MWVTSTVLFSDPFVNTDPNVNMWVYWHHGRDPMGMLCLPTIVIYPCRICMRVMGTALRLHLPCLPAIEVRYLNWWLPTLWLGAPIFLANVHAPHCGPFSYIASLWFFSEAHPGKNVKNSTHNSVNYPANNHTTGKPNPSYYLPDGGNESNIHINTYSALY